jgi:hypothetical protein
LKKTIALLIFVVISLTTLKAQLAGTKWDGIFNVPQSLMARLDFAKDTVKLIYVDKMQLPNGMDSGAVLEIMTYTLEKNMLSLKKTEGTSPCDTGIIGKYKTDIQGDKLVVTLVDDACPERAGAWNPYPLAKVK